MSEVNEEEITLDMQIAFIGVELDICKLMESRGAKIPTPIKNYEAILKTLQKIQQKEILIEMMRDSEEMGLYNSTED